MALTKASVFHYWSARYGTLPIVGGKPTHSRNSAGAVADARGELYNAIINTPRFSWETDKGTTANEKRAALLLEPARTNQVTAPIDFSNAAWVKTNCSITTGIDDPFGGTNAQRMTATAANATLQQQLVNSTSLTRINSLWARRRTGVGSFGFFDPMQAVQTVPALADKWQRFSSGAASGISRWSDIRLGTSGDAVDLYLAQMEDAASSSSEITVSGATRASDVFSWAFPPVPQGMIGHVRFVERGSLLGDGRVFQIGSAADANPRFVLYAASGVYSVTHGEGSSVTAALGVAPAIGDTVDLFPILYPDGHVQVIQSINGAAVTASANSGALAFSAAWSAATLWLGSVGGLSAIGISAMLDLKLVKYADVVASTAQGIADELRAFELSPAGDLL